MSITSVQSISSSIYQDVPLHSLEEYKQLAQPEAITDEALQNDHQLMLSRLAFELAERQRSVSVLPMHPIHANRFALQAGGAT
jgi:hypothetical protein